MSLLTSLINFVGVDTALPLVETLALESFESAGDAVVQRAFTLPTAVVTAITKKFGSDPVAAEAAVAAFAQAAVNLEHSLITPKA